MGTQQAPIMGEETKVAAHVKAEQGDPPGGQVASCPKNRAIAAKDQGQLGQRGWVKSKQLWQILGGGTGLSQDDLDTFEGQLIGATLGLSQGQVTALT